MTAILETLKADYLKAKKAYYNGKRPLMTDAQFDRLEERIRKLDPTWDELQKTGVSVNKKVEVALDQPMPSLNKAYPEAIDAWLGKFASDKYVVMYKVDGTSLQLTTVRGKHVRLRTRGDGTLGKDISFLIPHLNLPKFTSAVTMTMRLEAVISKANYAKWASEFDDPRSMVNGLFNRQKPHKALKDVELVLLGVYGQNLAYSLNAAKNWSGITPVPHSIRGDLDASTLTGLWDAAKIKARYHIDGLVVAPKSFVLDYTELAQGKKPKNIIAFKVNDDEDAVQVTVEKIIWQVTGRSRIVPKIYVTPTKIGGVMVKHAAAHNAKWMMDRGIGPGAVVSVLRSGGVIPKIVQVITKGKFQKPDVPYEQRGVHFVVAKASSTTRTKIDVINIVKFMKAVGIDFIAGKTAADLYAHGLNSPMSYFVALNMGHLSQTIAKAGFDNKTGRKMVTELKSKLTQPLSMKALMVGFQCYGVGIGKRKLEAIEAAGISLSKLSKTPTSELGNLLKSVPGFATSTIKVMTEGHSAWRGILADLSAMDYTVDGKLPTKKVKSAGSLAGHNVSFTSYRDKDHEAWVTDNGGEVISLGAKTTILLYKEGAKFVDKIEKARSRGVHVMTFDQLKTNGV